MLYHQNHLRLSPPTYTDMDDGATSTASSTEAEKSSSPTSSSSTTASSSSSFKFTHQLSPIELAEKVWRGRDARFGQLQVPRDYALTVEEAQALRELIIKEGDNLSSRYSGLVPVEWPTNLTGLHTKWGVCLRPVTKEGDFNDALPCRFLCLANPKCVYIKQTTGKVSNYYRNYYRAFSYQ